MIEWIGVILALSGSYMVSSGLFIGFWLFTLSSICLIYSAIKQSNKALIIMQTAFLLSNINGVYTFFFKG